MTNTTATGSSGRSGKGSDEFLLAALYVLFTAVAALSLYGGLPTALKAAYVPFVCIGGWLWLRRGGKRRQIASAYLKEYLLYILLMLVMTSVIYLAQRSEKALVVRGFEKLAFQSLTVAITVLAFFLFGKKAVDYTFYGFTVFFLTAIVFSLIRFGPADALSSVRTFILGFGEAKGFMRSLELHDAVFAVGVFVLYYYLDGVRKNPVKFCLAVFFFLLGFKRIGVLGLLLALPLGALLRRYCRDLKRTGLVLGALGVLGGFVYIVWIRNGGFAALTARLGVNSMGRDELYRFIGDYYSLSPRFIGRGFEYITLLMRSAEHPYINMAGTGAIHNGYITVFLEFGFFGYFLWTGFWLIWHHAWTSRFGRTAMLAQLLVSVYLFVTYATDNTAFYFFTGLVGRLMPMAFAQKGRREEKKAPDAEAAA